MSTYYDSFIVDLDGTVYWGNTVIPHAVTAINDCGERVVFATNNASTSPQEIAQKLQKMGFNADPGRVLTSADMGVAQLTTVISPGAEVLIVGTEFLEKLACDAGYRTVRQETSSTAAVLQGHSEDTGWRELSAAARAIHNGAHYVATNRDSSLPGSQGLNVGNGAMVAAVERSTGVSAVSDGKPSPAMMRSAARLVQGQHPLVIGDRLDTDIAGGVAAGYDTWCVLTGVASIVDICSAPPEHRPTFVSPSLLELGEALHGGALVATHNVNPHDVASRVEVRETTPGRVEAHFSGQGGSTVEKISALVAEAWQNSRSMHSIVGRDCADQKELDSWLIPQ